MAFGETSVLRRRMTPADVLEILQDGQGCLAEDPTERVEFDMPLDQAVAALGLDNDLAWSEDRYVWKILTQYFAASIPRSRWKAALRPWHTRTVRDLCALIASQATVGMIRPVSVLGRSCLPAGAFLAVRDALKAAGLDVSRLRPSTPLEPLLKRHGWAVRSEIAKLAPGKVPALDVVPPLVSTIGWALLGLGVLALLAALPAASVDMPGLVGLVMGAMAAMFLGVMGLAVGSLFPPRRAALGRLATFSDLCRAMVDCNGEQSGAPQ